MKIRKKRKIIEMLIRNAIKETSGSSINRVEYIKETLNIGLTNYEKQYS